MTTFDVQLEYIWDKTIDAVQKAWAEHAADYFRQIASMIENNEKGRIEIHHCSGGNNLSLTVKIDDEYTEFNI